MALVLEWLAGDYYQWIVDNRDNRSLDLPFMESPWPVMGILISYLYVVLRAGPRYMEKRKPYDLRNIIRIYNIAQVVLNALLCVTIGSTMWARDDFDWKCQLIDYSATPAGMREMRMAYYYFLLKILDLADTVFFVLRKKQSHVSFLHVYHHALMVFVTFWAVMFSPGGHGYLLGVWNTLVHAVMYYYYYRASYGDESAVWWKKYLTRLQLVQFVHLGCHFMIAIVMGSDCKYSKFWSWVALSQACIILAMFLNFYIKTYRKSETPKPVEKTN
ncbi:elongation of very long chain fatty acids protein AAEL008004-like [Uranotaenia lowii]|uniref:elongation of very long chain fatty acids protein AAEL008004-like n=1 Tax=Uranotaenia lowii TaxID=190385 RepID=UPI0024785199|nr:elongation of very long chain fatty acids protein AAEL008004-like [Uranotaenia lowii]